MWRYLGGAAVVTALLKDGVRIGVFAEGLVRFSSRGRCGREMPRYYVPPEELNLSST